MSDSDDFDDDLLALAGHSNGNDKASGARKRRRTSFDSDDDDGAVAAARDAAAAENPYPLEGKYRDAADRDRILAMAEIERESILYEREEEMNGIRERQRLNQRLREQQAQREKQESARAPAKKPQTAKESALSALKKKREAKVNKVSRAYSSSESDDDEGDDDDLESELDEPNFERSDAESDDDRAQARRDGDKDALEPLDFVDASSIRITRKQVAKFLYYPMFPDTVKGCFVRIAIGRDVYRVCTVKALVKAGRNYRLPTGELCGHVLECAHAHSTKRFEIIYVSDSAFTEKEFDHWKEGMAKDKLSLPRKYHVRRKLNDLKTMNKHELTSKEIDAMVAEKRSLQRLPSNVAQEKIRLKELLTEARELDDHARVEELENELASLEELQTAKRAHADLDRMSKLNERNRQKNAVSISKAEVSMAKGEQKEDNPFSRLKTKPKTFYGSAADQDAAKAAAAAAAAASQKTTAAEAEPVKVKAKPSGIDQLVASVELDLDDI
ncbi:RNA polymerase-associated protein rtf1 [Savitreella phatthalungensis]